MTLLQESIEENQEGMNIPCEVHQVLMEECHKGVDGVVHHLHGALMDHMVALPMVVVVAFTEVHQEVVEVVASMVDHLLMPCGDLEVREEDHP